MAPRFLCGPLVANIGHYADITIVRKETDDVYIRTEYIRSDVCARAMKKSFRGIDVSDRDMIIRLTLRASVRMFGMNESVRDYCYWHMQEIANLCGL